MTPTLDQVDRRQQVDSLRQDALSGEGDKK